MDSIQLSTTSASTEAALLRTAETDTARAATLLKKTTDADKDLVATLLAPPGAPGHQLDIHA